MKNNPYTAFLQNLYVESPRAAYELESMKYRLMAHTGLKDADALEVVSKIVAKSDGNTFTRENGTNPQGAMKMTDQTPIDFDHLSDDEKTFVGGELARIESSVRQRRAQAQQKELNAQYNAAMRALFNRPGFGAPTLTEKQAVRERFKALGLTDWTVTQ